MVFENLTENTDLFLAEVKRLSFLSCYNFSENS